MNDQHFTVTINPVFRPDAQDAVFYAGMSTGDPIATVRCYDRIVTINVTGATRVDVWKDEIDKAGEEEPVGVIRYGCDFVDYGIRTDKDLEDAETRLSFENNSWYEITLEPTDVGIHPRGTDFSNVEHTLDGAIEVAKRMLAALVRVVTVTRSTTYIVTNDEYADPFEAVCDEQYADIADENVLDISNDTALYFETETR